jgi:thiol-disulfide isomerase/thioredoxin
MFGAMLVLFPAPPRADNQVLPNIVGRTLDGKIASLKHSFDKKPMVVNFWWVKCSPCKQELPDLLAKADQHPEADFIFVHAETNAKTKTAYRVATVNGFLEQLDIVLPKVIVSNTKARLSAGVTALPTTLLVNRRGMVEETLVGFTPDNTKRIKNWLDARTAD